MGNYMGHEKDTGNQAWGEDLFQQRCMDLHGVDKVGAYDITTDASCSAWRQRARRKTGSGPPIAPLCRHPASTTSSNPRPTSSALKPPKATCELWYLLDRIGDKCA